MSLPVPLTLRVGEKFLTKQVKSLSFRKEAIGGVRSISFELARPLSRLDGLDPLSKVYIFDGRNGSTVAEGRLADTGRSASADEQRWDCVAFGPAQHASDITGPKVYIDRGMSDGWRPAYVVHPEVSIGTGSKPDAGATSSPGILINVPDGTALAGGFDGFRYRYERLWVTGGRLARVQTVWDSGTNDTQWNFRITSGTGGASLALNAAVGASTAGGTQVVTTFAAGYDTVLLEFAWTGAATTTTGDDNWAWWEQVAVEAVRKTKAGVDITSGYTGSTVASAIVEDLLGSGFLPQFDGANATVVATPGTFSQLAYMDGVTAAQILDDLMAIEPGFRWTTTPDTTGNGYGFRWEPWPTTVRYEATLDDGGSFPLSTQSLYNYVCVRYVDEAGDPRIVYLYKACPPLDDIFLMRQAYVDLGSEAGGFDQAVAAGETFLEEHNVPKNSGTLTVARPIRDIILGRMVQPWEIEPGELVRVAGVEAYPDVFNADTNDGQGVFRIFANDYTTEGNVATLALDSDPRETEDALVMLMKQRERR